MTIAGHDLVLAVTALTLPDRRPDAPQRTITTPSVSNRPNVAILAVWLNITANQLTDPSLYT
jgi:hypothetical protein